MAVTKATAERRRVLDAKVAQAWKEDPARTVKEVATTVGADWHDVEASRKRLGLPKPPRDYSRTQQATVKKPTIDASEATARALADRAEIDRLKSELKKIHKERLSDEAMAELLGSIADKEIPSPDWAINPEPRGKGGTPEVPVLTLCDWHLGEVVSLEETGGFNEYNVEIAEERVKTLLAATLHLCRNHGPGSYPGFICNLDGDFVSGGLHPELLKTDEFEIIPSMLKAVELLSEFLRTLADEFGFVYVPCSSGNHGRLTMKPEFKRYVYKNADWGIYKLLEREFRNDPRIVFSIPPDNDAHYKVWGKRFLMTHGDMLGVKGGDGIIGAIGPIMRGEIKTRGQQATMGRDYDMAIIGHWHQEIKLGRIIVANCLIGPNEYSMKVLRAVPTMPSQPLFFMHPWRGMSSYWNVGVGKKPLLIPSDPWVSFPKA